MSVCVYVCMYVCECVCVHLLADQSSHICFSEMAEPIWTHLSSFERLYRAIDQVRRLFGGHFRFRRYNGLSDVSGEFALFRSHICFSEMAEPIWTHLGSFERLYQVIDQVRRSFGEHFWFRRCNGLSFFAFLYGKDTELLQKSTFERSPGDP